MLKQAGSHTDCRRHALVIMDRTGSRERVSKLASMRRVGPLATALPKLMVREIIKPRGAAVEAFTRNGAAQFADQGAAQPQATGPRAQRPRHSLPQTTRKNHKWEVLRGPCLSIERLRWARWPLLYD